MGFVISPLAQRLLTAAIAIPILLSILWFNGPFVLIALTVIAVLGLWELRRIFVPTLWASYIFIGVFIVGFYSLFKICYGEGAFLQSIILFAVVF